MSVFLAFRGAQMGISTYLHVSYFRIQSISVFYCCFLTSTDLSWFYLISVDLFAVSWIWTWTDFCRILEISDDLWANLVGSTFSRIHPVSVSKHFNTILPGFCKSPQDLQAKVQYTSIHVQICTLLTRTQDLIYHLYLIKHTYVYVDFFVQTKSPTWMIMSVFLAFRGAKMGISTYLHVSYMYSIHTPLIIT